MDAEKIPLTEADTASYDSTAQMLKAAMAYVNPSLVPRTPGRWPDAAVRRAESRKP